MAITISGDNNNDKILASDNVIDQISGINIVGVLTATSFVGDVTGNVTGNLTGNVNSTSPLLLQTGGYERFRITGNNELGIAGANYGSSGQVLTSGGSGSAVTWSAIPAQATIANNANNRVITGGSGVNLNGEANLVFDGSSLGIGEATPSQKLQVAGDSGDACISLMRTNAASNDNAWGHVFFENSSDATLAAISARRESAADDAYLAFYTQSSGNSNVEKLRIGSDGNVKFSGEMSGNNAANILNHSGGFNFYASSNSSNNNNIIFCSANTAASEKLRITSDGEVGISPGGVTPTAGDLQAGDSQNKPLIHVKGTGVYGTGGEYNLLGRFEAGGDADDTGAMIVLNHSNDRGLAIIGGRSNGNRAFGALKSIDNVGRLTNAMVIGGGNGQGVDYIAFYTGESTSTTSRLHIANDGKVGIGSAIPAAKLHIKGGANENITLKLEPGATAGNYSELVLGRTSSAPAAQTTPVVKGGIPVSGVPGILFGSENTNLPAIGFQTPNSSNGHIVFSPKGSEKLRIDSSGKLLVGTQNPINTSTSKFQVASNDANGSAILARFNASVYSSYLDFYKSRSNTLGTAYVVNDDDHLGAIRYYAADGSNSGYTTAAEIYGSCDGGSGAAGDMPGRITFHTRADGAGQAMSERLRIDSSGNVSIHSAPYGGGGAAPQLYVRGTGGRQVKIHNSNVGTSMLQITNATTGEGEDAGSQLFTQATTGDFHIRNHFATGDLVFATKPSSGSQLERVRIGNTGVVHINSVGGGQAVIAFGDPAGNTFQSQNRIGGDTIFVADESISSAIYMPRQGCFVIITAFSDNTGVYPQPNTSCIAYVDCGASRNIRICDLGTGVGASVASKNAYTSNVSDCDNNKLTIMAGDTQGTFRLVNRESNNDYYYQISFL